MFTISEIPAAERKSWSKCKFQVTEEGREHAMQFVTRGQAAKYVAQREKEAAKLAAKEKAKRDAMNKLLAHPVGAAVEPLRSATIERVGQEFDAYVARIAERVAKANGDIDVLAPQPNSRTDGRIEYKRKQALRAAYYRICTHTGDYKAPIAVDQDKVVEACRAEMDNASAQYDAFIAKLVTKVGDDCTAASLAGTHVWGYSFLTVTKADGSTEIWKTQQILNVSVLGNVFNQWPTRLVK